MRRPLLLGHQRGDGIDTSAKKHANSNERLAFYMDLVSHDMVNDNQAVLSYLELILATPGLDKRTAEYARKAISHVRSSTLRIDNVKTITSARNAKTAKLGAADLHAALKESVDELPQVFPSKTVKVVKTPETRTASVVGGGVVKELLLTVMASVVKLDPGTNVTLNVSVIEDPDYGKRGWTVTIEDPNIKLPPVVENSDIDTVHTKDSSLAAKVSGMLFAKMAAEALGGDFSIESGDTSGKGASFVLKLRRAGGT